MAKLVFRYGSMNSSKSSNLIMEWYACRTNPKKGANYALVVKPSVDSRNQGVVSSRALETEINVDISIGKDEVGSVYSYVEKFGALNHFPRIIMVDEAQFLSKEQIDELASIVDKIGITVVCYGLMTNFKSELFEGSKRLVELSDIVERIRSECSLCDNESLMNARFIDGEIVVDGEEVVVGYEETYKSLCRKCYLEKVKNI